MKKKTKKIILITAGVLILVIAAALVISSFVGFQPKGVNLIKNGGTACPLNGIPNHIWRAWIFLCSRTARKGTAPE